MKTQEIKKVIEIEGVKLSEDAIRQLFFLQHCFHKENTGCEPNFNNETIKSDIEFINDSVHFMIDLAKDDPKTEKDILNVLWCLNDYKRLLDVLKSPEQNI